MQRKTSAEILTPIEPRKTPTERLYDLGMAVAQRKPSEPTSSVGLTLNAKGDVQITVDVTATDVAEAGRACEAEFDRLFKKYPRNGDGQ